MAAERGHHDTHFALLVGVDFYPKDSNDWHCLRGSVQDVREINEYLTRSPTQVQVQMLTATCNDPDPSRPVENGENLANHKNVVEKLEDIASRAPAGSLIYIHFSAHGTAIEPSSKFSDGSTGDLALVLLEGDNGLNVRYLRGVELAFQLRNMVDNGLRVTLVLDCCTSGSVLRDRSDPSVRYLPYNPRVDIAYPPIPGKNLGLQDIAVQPINRSGSMRPNWLVNPDGYTILTACGPTEEAKEIEVASQYHGALSYFLLRCFERYGQVNGRSHDIYSYVRARFLDPRFREHVSKQTPMLYGNQSLLFFENVACELGAIEVPIVQTRGKVQLEAGQVHCVCEGDKFVLLPQVVQQTSTGDGNELFFEVTSAGDLVSVLKMSDPQTTIHSGATVTACTRLSLRRFPIRVELRLPCLSVWTTALISRPSLDVSFAERNTLDSRTLYSFNVAIVAKNYYEIRDDSNQLVSGLPLSPYDLEENADYVLDIVEHLAQFKWLMGLTNRRLMDPDHPFPAMFSVSLTNPSGRVFQPGCMHSGHFHPWCSHSECVVDMKHGEKLIIDVENKSSPDDLGLYLHLYGMGSSWNIENLLKADFAVIPPRSSNQHVRDYKYGTTGKWRKKITMTVPDRQGEKRMCQCDDVFKILLTPQPTSFSLWELPELGKASKGHGVGEGRGDAPPTLSEDWALLSFHVRTSRV
ncbi:putative Peptidase C14 caspase domain-containing protein [Seiridium unicorne]|uniref:Peptidase C14 caspase domain-containing protein n=1 Tax=Seiridium unicorne TaxID=138068 RepID=A0ABR2UVM9_9PEZI